MSIVVIGLGNTYRRDDGVGPAVADACGRRNLGGVRVLREPADPADLLDAWSGAALAVLVDAAVSGSFPPGTVRCCRATDLDDGLPLGAHGVDLGATIRLGRALDRLPDEMLMVVIEPGDTGHGPGLTPAVAAAVPAAVDLVVAAITECRTPLPVPRTHPR